MLAMFLLLACDTDEASAPPPAPPAATAPAAATPAASVDAAGTLAKADAHDGEVDNVVHECAACALGMSGDPANAVQHEGYELHFCSEGCQQGFAADPNAGVARLADVVE